MSTTEGDILLERLRTRFRENVEKILLGIVEEENEGEEEEDETDSEEEEEETLLEEEIPNKSLLGIPFEVWVHHIFSYIGSNLNILNLIRVCKAFFVIGAHSLKDRRIQSRFAVQRIFEKEPSEVFLLKLLEWNCFDVKIGREFFVEMCINHKYFNIFEHVLKDEITPANSSLYDIMELYSSRKESNKISSIKFFQIYSKHPDFNISIFMKNANFDVLNESFTKEEEQEGSNINRKSLEDPDFLIKHTNYFQQFFILHTHQNRAIHLRSICYSDYSVLLEWILRLWSLKPDEMVAIVEESCKEKALKCLIIILGSPKFDQFWPKKRFQFMMKNLLFDRRTLHSQPYTSDSRIGESDMEVIVTKIMEKPELQENMNMSFLGFIVGSKSNYSGKQDSRPNFNVIVPFFKYWMLFLAKTTPNLVDYFFRKCIILSPYCNMFIKTVIETEGIRECVNFSYKNSEALRVVVRKKYYKSANLLLDTRELDPSCYNNQVLHEMVKSKGYLRASRYRNLEDFQRSEEGKLFWRMLNDHRVDPSVKSNQLFKMAKNWERDHGLGEIYSRLIFKNHKVFRSMGGKFDFYERKR